MTGPVTSEEDPHAAQPSPGVLPCRCKPTSVRGAVSRHHSGERSRLRGFDQRGEQRPRQYRDNARSSSVERVCSGGQGQLGKGQCGGAVGASSKSPSNSRSNSVACASC